MSFWNTVGNVASSAYDQLKKQNEEVEKYKQLYEGKSNEYLEDKKANGVFAQKAAASFILKSR